MQTSFCWHWLPQAPQLSGLVWRLTHARVVVPPTGQLVRPVEHAGPALHVPASQICVPVQTVPQAPHARGSYLVSRQIVAPIEVQAVRPGRQTHLPVPSQTSEFWQSLPHMPQWFGSSVVSVHACAPPKPLLHSVFMPSGQVHAPARHAEPLGQRKPQVLQLSGSVLRSTQRVPHIDAPALHLQAPASQVSPEAQRLPHVPQLFMSVIVLAHAAAGPMPHRRLPVGHAQAVAPAVVMHDCPAAQRAPHAPQLTGSLVRSAQPDGHVTFGALHGASIGGTTVSPGASLGAVSGGIGASGSGGAVSSGGSDESSGGNDESAPVVDVSSPVVDES